MLQWECLQGHVYLVQGEWIPSDKKYVQKKKVLNIVMFCSVDYDYDYDAGLLTVLTDNLDTCKSFVGSSRQRGCFGGQGAILGNPPSIQALRFLTNRLRTNIRYSWLEALSKFKLIGQLLVVCFMQTWIFNHYSGEYNFKSNVICHIESNVHATGFKMYLVLGAE